MQRCDKNCDQPSTRFVPSGLLGSSSNPTFPSEFDCPSIPFAEGRVSFDAMTTAEV